MKLGQIYLYLKGSRLLSSKIGYIVPEAGGKRFTPQNDGERLLYMLVGFKMMAKVGIHTI